MSAKVVIGGKPLSIEEVTDIAVFRAVIVLEENFAKKVEEFKDDAKFGVECEITPQTLGDDLPLLTVSQSRAVVAGFLSQLLASTRIRPTVVRHLVNILNSNVDFVLRQSSDMSSQIIELFFTNPLNLQFGIRAKELPEFENSTGAIAGIASLAIFGANSILTTLDAVVALSLEALGASAESYGEVNNAVSRLPGEVNSATAISLFVEGSRLARAGANKENKTLCVSSVTRAHTLNGYARQPLSAAQKAVNVELAAVPPVFDSFSQLPLAAVLSQAASALRPAVQGCESRISLLQQQQNAEKVPSPLPLPSSFVDDALAAAVALQQTVEALLRLAARETTLCQRTLAPREAAAAQAAAEKERARAAKAKEWEDQERARVAAMSEEERARHELGLAKKAAKAAKASAAAGPASGKSLEAENPLGLAVGTFRFRSRVFAGVAAAATEEEEENEVLASLSPFVRCKSGQEPLQVVLGSISDALRAGVHRLPKIPKGTRDYTPEQMEVRERCFNTIRSVFKQHGAQEIDTPVFEARDTLMGKYGEEGGKLIYDLADQGGELLSLRYDLTVPFARYLAMNGITNIKRFHIAKVYRRDNPQLARGRYREFYQCDFDVAGDYAPMMPDAEVLKVATEILSRLPIGEFQVKINHRGLLDAILELCGVPASKFRAICSAIDKLDKEPWSAVRAEMVDEKGLPGHSADKIWDFVQLKGDPKSLLQQLRDEARFGEHATALAALQDLHTLFGYLEAMNCLHFFSFDLSLARGLDYYTGVIYEAVLMDPQYGVGSIAAGGRYDNLVGMFAGAGTVVPCVGVSIGVERVFAIMEAKLRGESGRLQRTPAEVLVASIPSANKFNMAQKRMQMLSQLWDRAIPAETLMSSADPKLQKQITHSLEAGNSFLVVLAEDELEMGRVQVKNLATREEKQVSWDSVAQTLIDMGARTVKAGVSVE